MRRIAGLYCGALSCYDWLLHGSPYISGHDYELATDDENGPLKCKRCGDMG